jgi:hypothetical protein
MREVKAVNCTTLINPTNRTIVFDVGWQAIPETIVLNLVLFLVSTRFQSSSSHAQVVKGELLTNHTNFFLNDKVFPYNIHHIATASLG